LDHTGDNFLSPRKRALPVVPPKEVDALADRWLKRVKSNPLIAALIVLGTVVAAVIAFWQMAADFYERWVQVPVSLAAFNLSSTSDMYFQERPFNCKLEGVTVRTFMPDPHKEENHAVSLDFVFTNNSKSDAVINAVDLDVTEVGQFAGGRPGIVVPNHIYVVNLKHQVGIQSFALTPVYRVPGNDTGSFAVVFKPASEGMGLCWMMKAIFHTSLGNVSSEMFSVIMSNVEG
jgi:hypothetical protein